MMRIMICLYCRKMPDRKKQMTQHFENFWLRNMKYTESTVILLRPSSTAH